MKLSELVRMMRRERGLSQAELADKVGVSQASMSYYEREQTTPTDAIVAKLEEALELARGELLRRAQGPDQGAEAPAPIAEEHIEHHRREMLETFRSISHEHAVLDRPAAETGGDLAFAVDLRSHLVFAVVDGTGSGTPGALSSLFAASAMMGQLSLQQAGVVWPHEMIRATELVGRLLGAEDRLAEIFVGLFDRRHRELSYCRTSFPVPYVRSRNKILRLRGSQDEFGFCWSGKVTLGSDALLLVATDGVAHLATKSSRTYWDTPELKMAVQNSRTPEDLVQHLKRRAATEYGGQGKKDDMLALVLSL
ncbi:MAG: SpoIIE family protein phosphatase [Lentisphaeria bacterium]|nr:SpoIIE family protein phosphatase [Lentisphaeria bacterium]